MPSEVESSYASFREMNVVRQGGSHASIGLDSGVRSRGDTGRRESPMSSCCCAEKPPDLTTSRCPSCGSSGAAVDRQTVKALLTEMALRRLEAGAYRFCPDPDCDVVYFD